MPWTKEDAYKKNSNIKNDTDAKLWADTANGVLESCKNENGSDCEGKAIRIANSKIKPKGKVKKVHTKEETIEYFGDNEKEESVTNDKCDNNVELNKFISISKIHSEKRIVAGIVLEPDTVDLQGIYMIQRQ